MQANYGKLKGLINLIGLQIVYSISQLQSEEFESNY